jgi:hypothetical protein
MTTAALIAALVLAAAVAGLLAGYWRLHRRVATLENYMLGVQYDIGLLAITLDDLGIPLHNDLREAAFHARGGVTRDGDRIDG